MYCRMLHLEFRNTSEYILKYIKFWIKEKSEADINLIWKASYN